MKKPILLLLLLLTIFMTPAWASQFVVKRIEIEGTQRISPETVYTYLPIKPGQTLSSDKTAGIIQALYKTGFFEHITLARNGDTLIIKVVERETIGELKISGNSVIPTDKLTAVMKSLDIAEGRAYNRAVLDRIQQSLLNQYYQLGRFNARIDVTVTQMPRNRVLVKIDISEGLAAKIRRINIIGNHAFKESTLVNQMTISTPGLFTFVTQNDQYSQEKLEASLESLRNYYLDHGYLKVAVKSSQVSITPDRKSVYVTMVVEEGKIYTIKGYTLTGTFPIPREQLIKQIRVTPGQVFSRRDIVDSEKAMSDVMGDKGYVFATVSLNPTIDDKNREVWLEFTVKPGKRTYVRHIFFSDNSKTNDEVLRREVQQMEAAPVSTSQLEESKRRINLLPYMKDTQMTVTPVANSDDKVDVNYKVTENNSAELSARVGYSQVQHFLLGAGVNQKNFLGTGKTVGLNAEASRYERYYSANYTDPYFTQDGISRSMVVSASSTDPSAMNVSQSYTSNEYDFSDSYAIPIGQEKNAINRFELGYGYQNTTILLPSNRNYISNMVQDFTNHHGRHFAQLSLSAGLSRDSRDKAIFPTRGGRNAIGVNVFVPATSKSLKYYTVNYAGAYYVPLMKHYVLMTRGAMGYGNSFSNGMNYPYFKNFYAGGMDSVRGFSANTLGPRDNVRGTGEFGNPTGGNFMADASLGLILPSYFSDNIRMMGFLDAGNTWQTYDNRQFGGTGTGPLRYSAGVQVTWLSMMGPIDVSLARPLHHNRADELEAFQFSLGANFG